MTKLRATARLQLHHQFTLDDAARQVDYYADLGISHLYLSPIGAATKASMHGYDVVDPTLVSPELGGETALRRLVAALRQREMGIIVDIVPNHMATDMANPWWHDVLANGRQSRYGEFFDIDWHAPEVDGKIWLPILEAPLADMLAQGKLSLCADIEHGRIGLACAGQTLPLCCDSLRHVLMLAGLAVPAHSGQEDLLTAAAQVVAAPDTRARLEKAFDYLRDDPHAMQVLLDLQHYRLAWWRSGNDVLNYRRFFDISSLIALSTERPEVFDAVHALPLRLIEEGLIDGLRLDHVDGLSQPRAYLRKLRRRVDGAAAARPASLRQPISIHVEKILAEHESLRRDWPVSGTTGYDFMDQVSAVLHDPAGAVVLQEAWRDVSGRSGGFGREERLARRSLLETSLQAEFAACVRAWYSYARSGPEGRDLTQHALNRALSEILAYMPVYRTYLGPAAAQPADRQVLQDAFAAAGRHGNPDRAQLRAYLRRHLLDIPLCQLPLGKTRQALRLARRRFEQTAAPLNAKSVEDTAFYRYGPLLSRNEVGSDPRRFALDVADFHHANQQRGEHWPLAMLATATHDHKRGEDTRARLAVLSQRSAWFARLATGWVKRLHEYDALPAPGDVWMLLQTVLAVWPPTLVHDDTAGLRDLVERIQAWQLKAIREAKLRTRWTAPNERYEQACAALTEALLLAPALDGLRQELASAARSLDAPGALNGLVMTTLRLTAPGVADLYQGCERWDLSLVDPDNRRAVDYALRQRSLGETDDIEALLARYRDGAIKQQLIARLLRERQHHPELFVGAAYRPLALHGPAADQVLAFQRRQGDQRLLVVAPRLCAEAIKDDASPRVPAHHWQGTWLELPDDDTLCTYRDVLSKFSFLPEQNGLSLERLLGQWPVAVLRSESPT